MQAPLEEIHHPLLSEKKLRLYIKREDLLHPLIPGNKFRKLKYNIEEALRTKHKGLLTFGGPYSNHILATAHAGKLFGLKTVGIIRGEELQHKILNPTLSDAQKAGMKLVFIPREDYRVKDAPKFLSELQKQYPEYAILPEGGTNALAVKGCEEILEPSDLDFDVVTVAVGTGGTLAGIARKAAGKTRVLGFATLRGNFLKKDICNFVPEAHWEWIGQYHFGGYAKVNGALVHFINDFKKQHKIALDPIYTGKMMYGLWDLIQQGFFKPGSKILAIHTGGLQGIRGINARLGEQNLPIIK